MRLVLVACGLLFASPVAAAAQDGEDADPGEGGEDAANPADAEARGLFSAGEAAYSAGRFEDALGYFRRAYELSGRPSLLYNVGLSAANVGDDRAALEAFEQYLAEVEDASNRAVVEARIEALRRNIAEDEARARELADAEQRARAERERADAAAGSSSGARTAGWALLIGGGVAAVAGGVLFALGMSDVSTVEGAADGTPWDELRGAYDRAPLFTTIGLVAGGVGIAALATGVVLIVTSGGGESAPEVAIGPTGVTLRGSF